MVRWPVTPRNSGVTEPSWLTSDCLWYGVPQGGNPHFFGSECTLRQDLSPSKRFDPRTSNELNVRTIALCFSHIIRMPCYT